MRVERRDVDFLPSVLDRARVDAAEDDMPRAIREQHEKLHRDTDERAATPSAGDLSARVREQHERLHRTGR